MKKRSSKLMIVLTVIIDIILLMFALVQTARADSFCLTAHENYDKTGYWSRQCGPEPGKDFKTELEKDCKQTIRQIIARPGASWNSEYGWTGEESCQPYWPLTKTSLIKLYDTAAE